MSLGATEIVVIIGIALLLFGGARLANLGKGLGEGIRNFRRGLRDDGGDGERQSPTHVEEPPPKRLPGKAGADDTEKPA